MKTATFTVAKLRLAGPPAPRRLDCQSRNDPRDLADRLDAVPSTLRRRGRYQLITSDSFSWMSWVSLHPSLRHPASSSIERPCRNRGANPTPDSVGSEHRAQHADPQSWRHATWRTTSCFSGRSHFRPLGIGAARQAEVHRPLAQDIVKIGCLSHGAKYPHATGPIRIRDDL